MILLTKGTRVRVVVPTTWGWTGEATVVQDQRYARDLVRLVLDGKDPNEERFFCRREEVELVTREP